MMPSEHEQDPPSRLPRRAFVLLALGFGVGILPFQFTERETSLPQSGVMPPAVFSPFVQGLLPLEKPPGELRVFFTGASLTFGLPYEPAGQASFATLLEKGLRAVLRRDDIHVRPEAQPALDSEQVVTLAERLLLWNPDLVVVVLGANEYLNRVVRGAPILHEGVLGRATEHLSASAVLFDLLGMQLSAQGSTGPTGQQADETRVLFRKSIYAARPGRPPIEGLPVGPRDRAYMENRLRENMRRIGTACRAKGVRLVFALSVHGYDGAPPWCNELEPTSRELDAVFTAVERRPRASRFDAVESWMARYPNRPDLHYARARLLRWQDRGLDARADFRTALDLDLAPLHQTSAVRTAMAHEAEELGVPLVDLNAAFADKDGITGPERFIDYAHVDLEGHVLLAVFLAKKLAGRELPELPEGFEETFRRAARAHLDRALVPASIRTARARLALNNAKFFLWLGNFRDALPFLETAARELPEHDSTRGFGEEAKRLHEFCQTQLREAGR